MTIRERTSFDPSGEIPLSPDELAALATQLFADLSGISSAPAGVSTDSAALVGVSAPVPSLPASVPDATSLASLAHLAASLGGPYAAPATSHITSIPGTIPGRPDAAASLPATIPVASPTVPTSADFFSFAIPDLTSWFSAPREEPDYFELGGPEKSGGVRHGVLTPNAGGSHEVFDVETVRRDFPILRERVNGHQLAWLDNAATTQKPDAVIERISHFYRHENSNIHRAAHELAARATNAYEEARETVRRFLGASKTEEIIFVRGTTEAINLVSYAWGDKFVGPGDEIVITHLEHHANIVPWQRLAQRTGAVLRVAPVDDDGTLLLDGFEALLGPRTKLVSATHVSNALGTVNPVKQIVELAHRHGARVLIDGAQSVPHVGVDVRELGADFFVFSGHKIFGPTGIGVLYAREEVLAETPPWQSGGNMIADVTLDRSIYQGPPNKFEAGTGNIADAVGLGEAIRYVERIGIERIAEVEHALLAYATPRLAAVPGVRLIGTSPHKASVLSFTLDGHDNVEVGRQLNEVGIAVRAGHHCAQPILRRLGVESTVRPSFAFYNTFEEADRLVEGVQRIAARGRSL